MNDSRASLISPRLVLGLAIMVLGTLFLLDNMNVVDFDDALRDPAPSTASDDVGVRCPDAPAPAVSCRPRA